MTVEEKYGENFNLTDSQVEAEEYRIAQLEKLEKYKKCIERIKELIDEIVKEVDSL